jgi:hypothetical protein
VPADIVEILVGIVLSPAADAYSGFVDDGGGALDESDPDDGISRVRARALDSISRVLGSNPDPDVIALVLPAIDLAAREGSRRLLRHVPPAVVRLFPHDPPAAVEFFRTWMGRVDVTGYVANDVNALAYRVFDLDRQLAESLVERQLASNDKSMLSSGGYLGIYLAWRAEELTLSDGIGAYVVAAMGNASVRAGVATALSYLLDDLGDDLDAKDAEPRIGMKLLVALLDDDDEEVRRAALQSIQRLCGSLLRYTAFFAALARSEHLVDNSFVLFHALKGQPEQVPATVIDLLEGWLDRLAGAPQNQHALGSSYTAIELLLDVHAQTTPASAERSRCLDLFDRLVVLGADSEMLERHMDAAAS